MTVKKMQEDDLELLKFSLKWLRFTLFGEGDLKIKAGVRKKPEKKPSAGAKAKTRAGKKP
jgi:hypothetical protein